MNFLLLAAGMFALGCDDYIFAGLLPGISHSFGSSVAAAAQGISVYGFTYVAALPLLVFLLTKKPAQRVLLLGLATFIAGNVLTLFSTQLFLYIAGRAITGVGAGLYLPLAIATAGELAEPDAKGRSLSMAWSSNAFGAVVGIPIGLWLADLYHWRVAVAMILALSLLAFAGLASRKLATNVSAPPTLREQAELLTDRGVLSIICVTLLTATGGFGLYVYAAPVLAGSATAPSAALSLWNIGGLAGSFGIGYVVDRVQKPAWVMTGILATMASAFLLIPALRGIPLAGLLPYFVWGAMGWSTMTPQQYRLGQLKPGHDGTLVALNSSAVSMGGVVGPALGGLVLASGFDARKLPYVAVVSVLSALALQLSLLKPFPQELAAGAWS
jgi:predicted MFS family arabinose efflux permease